MTKDSDQQNIKKAPTKDLLNELICVYSEINVEIDEGVFSDSEEIRFDMPKYCVVRINELARRKGCNKATLCRMIFIEGLKQQGEK